MSEVSPKLKKTESGIETSLPVTEESAASSPPERSADPTSEERNFQVMESAVNSIVDQEKLQAVRARLEVRAQEERGVRENAARENMKEAIAAVQTLGNELQRRGRERLDILFDDSAVSLLRSGYAALSSIIEERVPLDTEKLADALKALHAGISRFGLPSKTTVREDPTSLKRIALSLGRVRSAVQTIGTHMSRDNPRVANSTTQLMSSIEIVSSKLQRMYALLNARFR